ncbi:hypothetical protein Tco_1104406 [Tanacetum coccineum]
MTKTKPKRQNQARERKVREAKFKVKSQPKSTPEKSKVKSEAVTEEKVNGPTRTHLMARLDYEYLEQINAYDLEEIDLKWQVAMLTMRVKRFIKKTGRKMDLNDKETVGFDRTKKNRDAPRRNAPVDTSTTNALVVQDGIGGYDWSFQAEEGITNFDLMAYTSQGSSSSSSLDSDAKYKTGLGYDSQMNESEVVHSVFNSRESDVDDSPVNDRFKIGKGFHAVPPPYTRNYMPSRPDLSFLD